MTTEAADSITIPAELVTEVCEAALHTLGQAAGEFQEQSEIAHGRNLEPVFDRFDTIRAIVDATYGVEGPVKLDLRSLRS